MAISSNSVIHYTRNIESLKGIIMSEGFRLKYCVEEIHIKDVREITSAVPMVSFCDIPLSSVSEHIDSYGSYGIGLYKNWAKRSGLNPVLYLENNSNLGESFLKLVNLSSKKLSESKELDDDTEDILVEILKTTMYLKNYDGQLKHGKIDDDNYRFYNEREWRFVPNSRDLLNDAPFIVWGNQYLDNKDSYNEKLKDNYLKFSFNDISYIIVDDESEIPEILSILNDIYEDVCTSRELKILGTRIITKNQIYNDF